MRLIDTDSTYLYFQGKYKNAESMTSVFGVQKMLDKNKIFKNKKYLLQEELGFYKYSDVIEMYKYYENINNTISYAKQLIIDIEAIMNQYEIKGANNKLASLVGTYPQNIAYLDISYEASIKIIDTIETKIKSLSIEAIRDLKLEYSKVCEG